MNNTQALTALIAHVDASENPVLLGWDEVVQWPNGLPTRLTEIGLLTKDVGARSLSCKGCEHQCTMDVVLTCDGQRAFMVCDHPDMQSQMGRIPVALERLQQWQTGALHFSRAISTLLGLDAIPTYSKELAGYKLGMRKGSDGRRWVNLSTRPLRLEIAGHSIAIGDVLFFDEDVLVIDEVRVNAMLSSKPANTGRTYASNINKQEARKMATQAMYQNWRDEYQAMLIKTPNKRDTWYSGQIAKLPISEGKSAETIRKHMKG